MKEKIISNRELMKAFNGEFTSDYEQKLPQPPVFKKYDGKEIISLSKDFKNVVVNNDFLKLFESRKTRRKYNNELMSLDQLSFLLWTTQGLKKEVGDEKKVTIRNVPSAGAHHPFETYLVVNNVEGLERGLYHYLVSEHKLEFLGKIEEQDNMVNNAFNGQVFALKASVLFMWAAVPYRCEWKYGLNAQKYSLLDAGHICQNLYLACEAIDYGTCAIGAYNQESMDKLTGLDSSPSGANDNEFVVYAATVGR